MGPSLRQIVGSANSYLGLINAAVSAMLKFGVSPYGPCYAAPDERKGDCTHRR
jgi:hypothetical protein